MDCRILLAMLMVWSVGASSEKSRRNQKTEDITRNSQGECFETKLDPHRASASSVLKKHDAWKAFVHQSINDWPWANRVNEGLNQTIFYQFESKQRLCRFAFSSRRDKMLYQAPTSFNLVASKDCIAWEILMTVQTKFISLDQERVWDIPKDKIQPYSCYGIYTISVSSGLHVSLQNVKFWVKDLIKTEENTESECFLAQLDPNRALASSVHKGHDAWKAFVHQSIDDWPWANRISEGLNQTIFYQFESNQRLCQFAFSSRRDKMLYQAPTSFQLVGSKDCLTWEILMLVQTKFLGLDQEHVWKVPEDKIKPFSCYGIHTISVSSGLHVTLQNIKMWVKDPIKTGGNVIESKCFLAKLDPTRANATSVLKDHDAWKAFVHQPMSDWPWANRIIDGLNQTIFYKFEYKQRLCRFAFSSRRDKMLYQAPTSFKLVASKDCITWEILMTVQTKFIGLDQEHVWEVPKDKIQPYSCYGINITSVSSGLHVTLQNIKMWVTEKNYACYRQCCDMKHGKYKNPHH